MNPDADRAASGGSPPNSRILGTVGLCLFLLLSLPACRKHKERAEMPSTDGRPSPPDLSRCTRLEVRHVPPLLWRLTPGSQGRFLLSPAEKEYLQSVKMVIVDDRERIEIFGRYIASGSYERRATGPIYPKERTYFDCYRDNERVTSFTVYGYLLRTQEEHVYRYGDDMQMNIIRLKPQIVPYVLRINCARRLWSFSEPFHFPAPGGTWTGWPKPCEWTDAIVRDLRARLRSDEYITKLLRCPSVGEGRCHWAMNPDCEPNSPADTVLLFETTDGWNQYGGPELFTFDNHDPQGGCVLLNDGTTLFVRTEEELQQLRWK